MKKINNPNMIGEQGYHLVAQRVTEIGLLIKPYPQPECGTDAIIEMRNPKTCEVSAQFVAVQIKTRTEGRYSNESEDIFTYTPSRKDFDYYQNGNTPFVLFLVRLCDKSIFWKKIPKENLSDRRIKFNKQNDNLLTNNAVNLINIFDQPLNASDALLSCYEAKILQIERSRMLLEYNNFSELRSELSINARSWIDSSREVAEYAQNLMSDISEKINHWKGDGQVEFQEILLWCDYLVSLRELFSNPTPPNYPEHAGPFSIQKIELARGTDLWEVFVAERMEYLLSVNKIESALAVANALEYMLNEYPKTALLTNKAASKGIDYLGKNKRYSIGTAYFLLSKFLRTGGLLKQSLAYMELSKIYYCEGVQSHDNEIEHCQYALAVSDALLGQTEKLFKKVAKPSKGTPFVDALNKIGYSYYFWAQSKISEAQEYAKLAEKEFSILGLEPFKKKCAQLITSLELWSHLSGENPISKFVAQSKYKTALSYIDMSKKNKIDFAKFAEWVKEQNPLVLLGVFQYIESFFKEAYRHEIVEIELILPKILAYEEGMRELRFQKLPVAKSVQEAHECLKGFLRISPGKPFPLFF